MLRYIALALLLVPTVAAAGPADSSGRPAVAAIERPLVHMGKKPGEEIDVLVGQTQPLMVAYGFELDPTRFRATLNGKDVTGLFSPEPNRADFLHLPLEMGWNRLEFDVWRVERPDLPRGMLSPNELYGFDIIVRPPPGITSAFQARPAPPPPPAEGRR